MNTIATGTDLLREALSGPRQNQLVIFARNVGISPASLDAFMRGADLPAAVLAALTIELWGGAVEFLPEENLLSPVAPQPATPLGTPPEFRHTVNINGEFLPAFVVGLPPRGPQPAEPPAPQTPRPGWTGGIWE